MCCALKVSFKDDLAIKVNYELVRGTIEELFWIIDVVLIYRERIRDQDAECIARATSSTPSLLAL